MALEQRLEIGKSIDCVDNCGKEFQTEEPGRTLRREHICVFRLAADSPNFFLFPSFHKVHRSLLCLEIIFCLLVAVRPGVMELCDSTCQVRNKKQVWKYL